MAINLKSLTHKTAVKAAAFLLAGASFAAMMFSLYGIASIEGSVGIRSCLAPDISGTPSVIGAASSYIDGICGLLSEYGDEDSIKRGDGIGPHVKSAEAQLYQKASADYADSHEGEQMTLALFREQYREELAEIPAEVTARRLSEYSDQSRAFLSNQDIYFSISIGGHSLENLSKDDDFFLSQPLHYVSDKFNSSSSINEMRYFRDIEPDDSIRFAFSESFVERTVRELAAGRAALIRGFWLLASSFALFILCMAVLTIGAGRRPRDAELHFSATDRLYLDAGALILAIFVGLVIGLAGLMLRVTFMDPGRVLAFCSAVCAYAGILLYIAAVKRIKQRRFFSHTLCGTVISGCVKTTRELFQTRSVSFKVICVLALIVFLTILCFASAIFIIPLFIAIAGISLWISKRFAAISKGAAAIRGGDFSHKISVTGGDFKALAGDINSIADGLDLALHKALKSERLKTELVANVSHDIRTPLTSIITYADLLASEGLQSENAGDHLEIIRRKAARLKLLTDDLFEMSRAASGNIEVDICEIDLENFVRQTLGELEDRVAESGLDFRVNVPPVRALADGKLLWRVFENLMSNIFKYAMPGSRVYIDGAAEDGCACLTVKNISRFELNVDPSELTERFKRGDSARASEGHGLGLSIVESFILAQNGSFEVEIDGDLFKTVIRLPSPKAA